MKFSAAFASICALFLIVFTAPAVFGEIPVEIQISPSTLNLTYPGEVVTVHTNISYSSVDSAFVTLNGVAIAWSKSDARGNFVAKFTAADVKGIVVPGTNELTLAGLTKSEEAFSGTDEIRVIDGYRKK